MATGPINKSTTQPAAAALATLSTSKAHDAAAGNGVLGVKDLKSRKNDGKPSNYDVQISASGKGRAEAMQKAHEIAMATPDVREDRVAALKKQIQDGTYQADSGAIADGMLREAIKDRLAETER